MTTAPVELIVLDVHGVVLNSPLRSFFHTMAVATGQDPYDVQRRWDRELRVPTWTGELSDEAVWNGLLGPGRRRGTPIWWRSQMEATYRPGPVVPLLDTWARRAPIWLLSNHRGTWLRERLERMDLIRHFTRILVSDALGAVKPAPEAFQPILETGVDPARVLYVDDQLHNVVAARRHGLQGLQLQADEASLAVVDRAVQGRPRRASTRAS